MIQSKARKLTLGQDFDNFTGTHLCACVLLCVHACISVEFYQVGSQVATTTINTLIFPVNTDAPNRSFITTPILHPSLVLQLYGFFLNYILWKYS